MNNLLSIGFLLLMSQFSFAQDTVSVDWVLEHSYTVDSADTWSVDGLENVYISHKGVINKYDSVGVNKFTQSIKSLGKMEQFLPINTMKLVHFSSDQQTLCFFDNTLTRSQDCIDLAEHEIYNATRVAVSSRPDKLWVVDNINSELTLMDLTQNKNQEIQIENLRGVLDLNGISEIIERDNRLFILDEDRGVYLFDIYGSLIKFIQIKGIQDIDAIGQSLFMLDGSKLKVSNIRTADIQVLNLPQKDVIDFAVSNRAIFLRTKSNVYKYRL